MEHSRKLKSSRQFLSPQHLKKMIPQLILSLSIFSFLFSYSSKSHYFSTNYFYPLRYALNKNCIFLICNGLLVFLAKTSGFVRSPSDLNLNDILLKPIGDDLQTALETKDEKYVANQTARDFEDEEEKKGIDRCSSTQTPNEVSISIEDLDDVKNDEIIEGESRKFWLFDEEDEQELYKEEVDEDEEDTKELNQKFEDFIRKMKEEIMINEAQQKQLVLVN